MPAKKSSSKANKSPEAKKGKSASKKSRAKKKRSTASKKTKKKDPALARDIKEAVDRLPDFVMSEASKRKKHDMISDLYTQSDTKKERLTIPEEKDTKKHMLIVGVTSIAVLVFALWAWNLRVMFYDANTVRAENEPMWAEATADFGAVLETLTPREEENSADTAGSENNLKERIGATLANIFAASPSSTETNTSTETSNH